MKTGVIAGNFDIIHPGYIHMFTECKKRCDYFVVALHRDPSIERPEKLKPILTTEERVEMLFSLRQIDSVVIYDTEDDLYNELKNGDYSVRFLGDDYRDKPFTGDDLPIEISFIPRDHGWSTTKYKNLIAKSLK
jgi:glycerol-3-phosphate cytidylyltransferase